MQRLIGLVICLLLAACVLCAAGTAVAYGAVRGDADGDGRVTSLDVTVIQRVTAGVLTDDDGMIASRGDVTGEGLSVVDATAIQYYLAGFKDDYHIGENTGSTFPIVFPTDDNQLPVL